MILTTLPEINTSRNMVEVFQGYNHNLRINEGEFYDMKNLTSSHYPILAPRPARGIFTETTSNPVGLIEKDALCYVKAIGVGDGSDIYFVMNGSEYHLGLSDIPADKERNLISMGAYVIVMPDKMYINTIDTEDKGSIEASFIATDEAEVKFTLCEMDGTDYEVDMTSPNEPTPETAGVEKLPNGYVWLDTSVTPNSLKTYSDTTGMWVSVATTYIKISCDNIGANFKENDGVTISGITVPSLSDLNNTMVVYARDDDSIVVVGILDVSQSNTQTGGIKVERLMPHLDFIVESNNRLWGCRYGTNRNGEIVNELYASKLGDFKNWNCFMGISTDSYYVSLGTDGQFTGAISYLGYPLFFKENCLHTVYGRYPAEYQVQDTACRGVQKGSSKSLAMVNEVLYYKSRTGICAYNGALPAEISSVLGEKAYSNAVACAHKGKYYISMKDVSTGEYVLFVYDTVRGLWHKEDNLQVKAFCPIDEEIYFTDTDDNVIKTIFGSGTKDTELVEWMAETGIIGCSSPDKKYVSRMTIRLSIDTGADVAFFIEYDSSGIWKPISTIHGDRLRTFALPIRPQRNDHFRIRMEGRGNVKVFSIAKITEQGSDM